LHSVFGMKTREDCLRLIDTDVVERDPKLKDVDYTKD
jgi:hypothetical protein